MGNVSLKVLEMSLNFLFKKGCKPCVTDFSKIQLVVYYQSCVLIG